MQKNLKIQTIPFYQRLPQSTIHPIHFPKPNTHHNTPLTLLFPINYPAPPHIIQTIKPIYNQLQLNPQPFQLIHDPLINPHLITHTYPHPHLLIPTSRQQTIINFLISQTSYNQFIFNQKNFL
ncbi:undecaprenyl diphosphate synthase family protein, partial [Staphylococcus epidermidis]|uniref:undecaprenyl diphosphate synthase family protein n=1 Tax=Staphylococcus epidermidis TaxID=1282 RepID=UPI0037DA664A